MTKKYNKLIKLILLLTACGAALKATVDYFTDQEIDYYWLVATSLIWGIYGGMTIFEGKKHSKKLDK